MVACTVGWRRICLLASLMMTLAGCAQEAWYELERLEVRRPGSEEDMLDERQQLGGIVIECRGELMAIVIPQAAPGFSDKVLIAVRKGGTQYDRPVKQRFPLPRRYTPEAVHFLNGEFDTPEGIYRSVTRSMHGSQPD